MERRIKKVYKKLPPHTNEVHPLTNSGEVSKPLVIGIITVVSIIILSLLLLYSGQFVGKAFFTGEEGSAGATLISDAGAEVNSVEEGKSFSLIVKANTGAAKVNAIGFELSLGVACDNVLGITNLLKWEIGIDNPCKDGKITFEYATIGAEKSGSFDVAKIDIKGLAAGDYEFSFWSPVVGSTFQALDSTTQDNVITNAPDFVVSVNPAPKCGDGVILGVEECDGFNFAGKSCQTQGDYIGGQLVCTNACKIDVSQCVAAPPACGNGVIDISAGEKCDNSATPQILSDLSCSTEGFVIGQLSCNADCTLNIAQCNVCNPGVSICVDATSYKQCNADGSGYNLPVACKEGEQCNGGVCAAIGAPPVPPPAPPACGNFVIDISAGENAGEKCDNSATPKILSDLSCSTEGFLGGGQLSCNADCTLNTIQCKVCNPEESICVDQTSYKQCKADGSGYDVPVTCAADEQCNGGICAAPIQPKDTDGDGINDDLDLCAAKGEKSLVYKSGTLIGCYLGDEDKNNCISSSEYTLFKAKFKKDFGGIQSELTAADYNIFKAKYKKGLLPLCPI